jgi:16S rRNA (cytosine967-C5)-methyltransferase
MSNPNARQLVVQALRNWRTSPSFADELIHELFRTTRLGASDRAFATELFYGILRNLRLLDFWVELLRSGRLAEPLRDVIRIGLYQIFFLDTPAHAAVYETVELAPTRGRALVNGVLRSAIRRTDELRTRADEQPLGVRYSHPDFLLEKWERIFGPAEVLALCQWDNRPAPVYARVNELKTSVAEFLRNHGESAAVAERSGFVSLRTLPLSAIADGHCYVQDPSTTLACELLDPQPGELVLDACAAPGGKTGYLAQLMRNSGQIVAGDRDQRRLERLGKNMVRLGATITAPMLCDWTTGDGPPACRDMRFDRILVDAPCSNTGVIRRRVDVRWRLRPDDFAEMQRLQLAIVRSVSSLLKPGGTLVYSTCSIEPEENEEVAERIAATMPRFRIDDQRTSLPFRDEFDGAFAVRLQSE